MELADEAVVFLDDALLILDKPPGLPVHATLDPDRDHLVRAAARWLERRGLDAAHLGLGHRLDVGTSGLVAMGRRPDVTARLTAQFAERTVQKVYMALTSRLDPLPAGALEVRNHLGASKDRHGIPVIAVRSGGDRAWTTLRVVRTSVQAVLWRAELHTGRRHQIRAHLTGLGMPIAGDVDYGTSLPAARPMLHAAQLTFAHPVSGESLHFSSRLPLDFRVAAARLGIDWMATGEP